MGIALRNGETLLAEARIHWVSCLSEIAVFLIALFIGGGLVLAADSDRGQRVAFAAGLAFLGVLPLVRVWLKNKVNTFSVTNQRIVIEEGIVSRLTTEIPLSKINDITMRRGLFQRLVGAGDIAVYTGNDISTVFKNIADPERMREAISGAR